MAHKGLANKHEMYRILLGGGSLQRRIQRTENMQGNDLDARTDTVP